MYSFLPLDEGNDRKLTAALGLIRPIIIPSSSASLGHGVDTAAHFVLVDAEGKPPSIEDVAGWLETGADRVILPVSIAKLCIGSIPKERIILLFDAWATNTISGELLSGVSGLMVQTRTLDHEVVSSFQSFFKEHSFYVMCTGPDIPTASSIREFFEASVTLVIPTTQMSFQDIPGEPHLLTPADALLATIKSDRVDGLYPTIISAANHGGKSLGLVYSSRDSIHQALVSGTGVYQSRKHGLWRKGETSGATQTLISIRDDCDQDALEFSVIQHGSGFCHTGTQSCFGDLSGLSALEETLLSRKKDAIEGSYTRRLLEDENLLAAKIREEAQELIDAQSKEDVASEAADLIYFALTRCVSKGVSLDDIEKVLDLRAKKITRRPGNAKPAFVARPTPVTPKHPITSSSASNSGASQSINPSAPIQMRTADLATISTNERKQLLRRPVLKSDEMIAKVKPIVDDVRQRGDAALIELTAKFDKVTLTSTVIRPPFAPETMNIPEDVKNAIDVAYQNIHTFHAAQVEKAPLVVETMPGVTCTRFARPIARVGLYVPGGTAILPSTALMLGIPAQVAGCREIVLATPPRPDGSVSPEVMYVAELVGATAILVAGGAQAVAAMAYGTDSVPKVDKIFGPGNQWVTAAKMLVQNDTDALVSIDMPAGPSEVLVMTDSTGNPSYIAADLLSQAEHGVDSQVVLVAIGITEEHLASITKEIDTQARALPRVNIIRESVAKSIIVRARSLDEAVAFSNEYAPEHLILHLKDAPGALEHIDNAGSVFVGGFTPESCGDYASGTNHTLPTNGYARQFSGVNSLSFQKHITSQEITRSGLDVLGPIVITLAECEGLSAHANAVRVRLQK